MSFYDEMATVARDLLAEFGATITLRRITDAEFDPITGIASGGDSEDLTSTGVVRTYRAGLIDGSRIQRGDRLLILDDSQIPLMSDTVILDSVPWSIVDIEPKNPAGTPLVYFVQIRA